jgi:hypothetical protein
LGATDIVTERGDEGGARIMDLTNGVGADSVLECVGTQESMMQAIRAAALTSGIADDELVLDGEGRSRYPWPHATPSSAADLQAADFSRYTVFCRLRSVAARLFRSAEAGR